MKKIKDASPSLVLQIGHTCDVQSLSFSPDGCRLISRGCEDASRLWDVRRLKLLQTFPPGWAAFFRPDGRVVIWRSGPERTELLDEATGVVEAAFDGVSGPMVLGPDGRHAAHLAWGRLSLWETATGKCLWRRGAPRRCVCDFLFSADGRFLAVREEPAPPSSPEMQATVLVVRGVRTGRASRQLPDQGIRLLLLANNPMFATPYAGEHARAGTVLGLWERATSRQWTVPESDPDGLNVIALSRDGTLLATTAGQKGLCCRHLESGKVWEIPCMDWEACYKIKAMAFSPDDRTLAISGFQREIQLIDLHTRVEIGSLSCLPVGIGSPDVLSAAGGLITADDDNVMRIWNLKTATLARRLGEHGQLDGQSGDDRPTVQTSGYAAFWCGAKSSPDGRRVATLGAGGTVGCFDAAFGRRLWTRRCPEMNFTALCWLPDGRRLVTAGWGWDENRQHCRGTVRMLDAGNGEEIRTVLRQDRDIRRATLSPDGQCLALISEDTLLFCDLPTGQVTGIDSRFDGEAHGVAFSPAGRLLAFSDGEATVFLWDRAASKAIAALNLHAPAAGSVAFSPDGRLLAVGGCYEETIYIFDVARRELIHRLRGHTESGNTVKFTSDGRRLLSSGGDCTLRVWDPIRGELLATLCVLPPKTEGGVSEDWIWYSPQGYYDCSPGGQRYVRWHIGGRLLPCSRFKQRFHRPDRLRALLYASG